MNEDHQASPRMRQVSSVATSSNEVSQYCLSITIENFALLVVRSANESMLGGRDHAKLTVRQNQGSLALRM